MRRAIWDTLHRSTVRLVGWVRLAQFAPAVVLLVMSGMPVYRSPVLAWTVIVVAALWSLTLFMIGTRHPRHQSAWVVTDVVVISAFTFIVGRQSEGADVVSWENWTIGPVMGAAVLAVATMSTAAALTATAVLGASYLAGTAHAWHVPSVLPKAITNVGSLLAFVLVAIVFMAILRARTRELADLSAEVTRRRELEAAQRAAAIERERQARLVHDTALSTLTMLAHGQIDATDAAVRRRCARDAERLRDFVSTSRHAGAVALAEALREQVDDARAMGLTVELRAEGVDDIVPPDVNDAFVMAVREALNNVARHAEGSRARVTAWSGPGGKVAVSVVDNGPGFNIDTAASGGGVERSIVARFAEIGGRAAVISDPGLGTAVELSWQPR